MDPASIASITSFISSAAPIVSVASTVGSMFMGARQSSAAEEAAIAQQQAAADTAAYNAEIARKNAAIEQSKTDAQLEQADREKRLRLGSNIASAGASGMAFSGSSLIDILSDNAAQEELNIGTIKQAGYLAKQNYLQQAGLYNAQSQNAAGQISGIKTANKYKSASNILGGTTTLLEKAPSAISSINKLF